MTIEIKTPEQIAAAALPAFIGDNDASNAFSEDDLLTFAAIAIEADRSQRTSRKLTDAEYDGIIEAIDRAKSDDRSLDSDEYASIVLEALGVTYP